MSRKTKSPDFYERYPALFHDYYPTIRSQIVAQLSEAGFAFYKSVLELDAIIDNQETYRIFSVLELQESAIKKLSLVFPEDSHFWKLWQQRKTEYKEAIALEKELHYHFCDKKYCEVADKKSAFGKVAIDSLYVISEEKDTSLYKNLLQSHQYFSLGFQIYDDVIDFREDFNGSQFNIAVYELSKQLNFQNYSNAEPLHKIFYIKGLGFELLQKSINSFEKAKTYLNDTESEWYKTITEMQDAVCAFYDNTFAYIEILKKKNELKKIPQKRSFLEYSPIQNSAIKKGMDFIAKKFSENYVELQHFMYLSNKEGFENMQQIHYSDTFQRAMLNDCLLQISEKLNLKTDVFFREENLYILEKINKDEIGGWSYFPTVQEIAADIDDLGQIMQQFILTKNREWVDTYCLNATNTAIEDRTTENGGIETWIIPKKPKNEKQIKQDFFNTTKWGKGPDVEVVANFLYALFLYNAEKYTGTIKKGIDYLVSEQKKEGFWESRWYYGNYYGTYVCIRLLTCFHEKYTDAKQKALQFLLHSQNQDGSFGKEEHRILSTSFARMSLKYYDIDEKILENSERFLLENQNENGSWKAENFIKPKANEPYKSQTLTTAFVLKSFL